MTRPLVLLIKEFSPAHSPPSPLPQVCTLQYKQRSDCCKKFKRKEDVEYNNTKLYQQLVSSLGTRVAVVFQDYT